MSTFNRQSNGILAYYLQEQIKKKDQNINAKVKSYENELINLTKSVLFNQRAQSDKNRGNIQDINQLRSDKKRTSRQLSSRHVNRSSQIHDADEVLSYSIVNKNISDNMFEDNNFKAVYKSNLIQQAKQYNIKNQKYQIQKTSIFPSDIIEVASQFPEMNNNKISSNKLDSLKIDNNQDYIIGCEEIDLFNQIIMKDGSQSSQSRYINQGFKKSRNTFLEKIQTEQLLKKNDKYIYKNLVEQKMQAQHQSFKTLVNFFRKDDIIDKSVVFKKIQISDQQILQAHLNDAEKNNYYLERRNKDSLLQNYSQKELKCNNQITFTPGFKIQSKNQNQEINQTIQDTDTNLCKDHQNIQIKQEKLQVKENIQKKKSSNSENGNKILRIEIDNLKFIEGQIQAIEDESESDALSTAKNKQREDFPMWIKQGLQQKNKQIFMIDQEKKEMDEYFCEDSSENEGIIQQIKSHRLKTKNYFIKFKDKIMIDKLTDPQRLIKYDHDLMRKSNPDIFQKIQQERLKDFLKLKSRKQSFYLNDKINQKKLQINNLKEIINE